MSELLFIFGAGAHARKVYYYAVDLGWQVEGFVDERPSTESPVPGVAVIHPDTLATTQPGAAVFVAVGDPEARATLMGWLTARGWHLPVLKHRTAWIAPDVLLGSGTLVAAGAVVETGTIIGRGVIIDAGVVVDHDCCIGDFCHLKPGVVLGPRSEIRSTP